MSGDIPAGHMGRMLHEERFMQMFGDFTNWRIDDYMRQMEAEKRKGRILPFIRGLRLSAHLIYLIRELLSGSGLTANWGHLLDNELTFCSCECDVIIHRNGHVRQWNGTSDKPVMDFRFIKSEQAVVVISCKSHLVSSNIDRDYCESMKTFVDKVWLFAECCGPKSVESIRSRAEEYGYQKFWALYTWTKQTVPIPDKKGWNDFVKEVEKLKS